MNHPPPGKIIAPAAFLGATVLMLLAAGGCRESIPEGSLVLTQAPPRPMGSTPAYADDLDLRYPAGSRVVLLLPPYKSGPAKVLSKGLLAAGSLVVPPAADKVLFVGKENANAAWQIYESRLDGRAPRAITALPGGAMDPAIAPGDTIIFSSPVPKTAKAGESLPALYARTADGSVRRLTFGSTPAAEPTLLRDGRVLFVSPRAESVQGGGAAGPTALFTIQTDGTEVTAFALDHDGAAIARRPRELLDGRVAFIAAEAANASSGWAEGVQTARPFASRARLFMFPDVSCRAVEPAADGTLLACCANRGLAGRSMTGTFALYRLDASAPALGAPLYDDPKWDEIEAAFVARRPAPMGHISAMAPGKKTGTILCLDANFTRKPATPGAAGTAGSRIRILAGSSPADSRVLGEVPLQADGSLMAEVPVDIPLGFERVDKEGRVLDRVPPFLWVRPGENRSCIGCHEPYNRTVRNSRPIAAGHAPVRMPLVGDATTTMAANQTQ